MFDFPSLWAEELWIKDDSSRWFIPKWDISIRSLGRKSKPCRCDMQQNHFLDVFRWVIWLSLAAAICNRTSFTNRTMIQCWKPSDKLCESRDGAWWGARYGRSMAEDQMNFLTLKIFINIHLRCATKSDQRRICRSLTRGPWEMSKLCGSSCFCAADLPGSWISEPLFTGEHETQASLSFSLPRIKCYYGFSPLVVIKCVTNCRTFSGFFSTWDRVSFSYLWVSYCLLL
jgi:hypothetical protein